jgi:predicted nucleic acid-binding protein
MPDIVISDTSCLILLSKIEMISLVRELYGKIIVTDIVASEYGEPLPEFIEIRKLKDNVHFKILEQAIDAGEASSIALCLEIPNSLIILDDKKARKVASQLNIPHTGVIGVLVQAKKLGIIEKVKPFLDMLKSTGMWVSSEIYSEVLSITNEN